MDVYNSDYFIVNKLSLTSIGLWPYQNTKTKFISRIFITLAMIAVIVPHVRNINTLLTLIHCD